MVASLLPGLLTYYPVDQFAVAPPLPGEPAVAGLHVEAWAPNKLRPGSPPFAAPRWHLPNEAEVRRSTTLTAQKPGRLCFLGYGLITVWAPSKLCLGSPPFASRAGPCPARLRCAQVNCPCGLREVSKHSLGFQAWSPFEPRVEICTSGTCAALECARGPPPLALT